MKTQRMTFLAGCAIAMVLTSGAVAKAEPVRIVILSGANVHEWKATTPFLEKMYGDSKKFKVVETVNDVAKITAATFAKCDVIVSNWTCHPVMTGGPWTAEGKKAFGDAVRAGKGVVQFHAACSACNDWEDFQEISGVTWKWQYTNHTAYHTFKVVMRNASHPITKGLSDFWITDELYQKMAKMGKSEFHALANSFAEAVYGGTGAWEPMLITTQLGKGRGVNFLLGHDVHAMQNVAWQTIMLRCTEWAATGRVTIPVPEDWPTTASAADVVGVDVDAALKAATVYAFGQGNAPLSPVENLVTCSTSRTGKTAVADRAKLATKLAEMIPACTTPEGKAFFCKQLAMIGTPEQVPVIAPLLVDEKTAMMARYALERIPGTASTKALTDACTKLSGQLKIGAINSLGTKADAAAVVVLVPMIKDVDAQVVSAVIAALGKIGTPQATDALREAREAATEATRPSVNDALLTCAERLLAGGNKPAAASIYKLLYGPSESPRTRAAALHGLITSEPWQATVFIKEALDSKESELHTMAAYVLRNIPKAGDTKEIASRVLGLSPPLQVLMLAALADRGDKAALMTVRRAADSENESVRVAAIAAMARLGDEGDVQFLAERAVKGTAAEKTAVSATLAAIPGASAEQGILSLLANGDANARTVCAVALVARNAGSKLIDLLTKAKADKDAGLQLAIVPVLWQVGSDRALQAVRQATSSEDKPVQAAAINALASWTTPAAMTDLVSAAKDPRFESARPALTLAIVRLLPQAIRSMPADRQAADGVALIEQILQLPAPTDKTTVLAALGSQRGPAALALAMKYVGQPDLTEAAGSAANEDRGRTR